MTATQRVLSTPELVAEIFAWLASHHHDSHSDKDSRDNPQELGLVGTQPQYSSAQDIRDPRLRAKVKRILQKMPGKSIQTCVDALAHSNGKDKDAIKYLSRTDLVSESGCDVTLVRCGLVNTLWFHEAMRYLWRNPTKDGTSLCVRFEKVDPSRRQFYANFVRAGDLIDVDERDVKPFVNVRKYIDALFGLHFPRMNHLNVRLERSRKGVNLPWIDARSVAVIHVSVVGTLWDAQTEKFVAVPGPWRLTKEMVMCLARLIDVCPFVFLFNLGSVALGDF